MSAVRTCDSLGRPLRYKSFKCPCGVTDSALFYPYVKNQCKRCYKKYQADFRRRNALGKRVTKDKKYALKKRYGLSPEQYIAMADAQGGLCAICRVDPAQQGSQRGWLHVDHNHGTGAVRGLLCNGCNRAIGFIRDNPSVAKAIADYLEKNGGY